MKKTFKQAVQEQMEIISLDDQQLDQLIKMQNEYSQKPVAPVSLKIKNRNWFSITASVMLVFALGIFATQLYFSQSANMLIQKIANEVAGNHLKMKPMEVQTAAINDLQDYFTKLDFMPSQSDYLNQASEFNLAGGRYCSIQGSTAAQLRYKDFKGEYITLFETPNNPELFNKIPDRDKGEKPIITYAKGIKVTIWQERGLLMVSTEKPK